MNATPLSKLTSAYLGKFFQNKNIPYEEWNIVIDGTSHVINNQTVIDSILKAQPEEQRILADTICELESSNTDINIFLKHLAFESKSLVVRSDI